MFDVFCSGVFLAWLLVYSMVFDLRTNKKLVLSTSGSQLLSLNSGIENFQSATSILDFQLWNWKPFNYKLQYWGFLQYWSLNLQYWSFPATSILKFAVFNSNFNIEVFFNIEVWTFNIEVFRQLQYWSLHFSIPTFNIEADVQYWSFKNLLNSRCPWGP